MVPFPRMVSLPVRPVGLCKTTPEDFVVEELPAYLPSGEGEHLYLWVEKRNVAAEFLNRHVARTLDVSTGDLGTAGLKDKRAVTRQWMSVPARAAERISEINTPEITVLSQARHGNKLRTGHLKGNRFNILIRFPQTATESDSGSASQIFPELSAAFGQVARGIANYYGDQRFGRDGETLQLGLDLLSRKVTPRDIPYSRRKFLLKLALSAVQSHLFNLALADRIQDGLAQKVLAGDVMELNLSGARFLAEAVDIEQPRCDVGETVVTGPMFGTRMKQPFGEPLSREQKVLDREGLTLAAFEGFGDLTQGTRRPYVIRPEGFTAALEPEGIRLQFSLPSGVYATTLLEELFDLQFAAQASSSTTSEEVSPVDN